MKTPQECRITSGFIYIWLEVREDVCHLCQNCMFSLNLSRTESERRWAILKNTMSVKSLFALLKISLISWSLPVQNLWSKRFSDVEQTLWWSQNITKKSILQQIHIYFMYLSVWRARRGVCFRVVLVFLQLNPWNQSLVTRSWLQKHTFNLKVNK